MNSQTIIRGLATLFVAYPTPVAFFNIANSTICSGASPGIEITGNITDANMQYIWSRDTPANITGTPTIGTSANFAPGAAFAIPGTLINSGTVTQEVTYTITPRSNGCNGTPIIVIVTVAPRVTPGAIAANQTICTNGDPVAFTQTTSATGIILSYQWQISTTSATAGFTDIPGATYLTYDAPGPLTQNTWYRRIATSTVNSVSCSSAPTNAVLITVNIINPGSISGDQTVCSPGDPATLTSSVAASGGIGTRSYQWQMNTLDCEAPEASWIPITGATGVTYNPPAGLLVTTHYRRLAQYATGACFEASNCVTVYVNNVTGGAIAGDQTICSTNPDAFTQTTASTGSGTLTYQWQLSTSSSSGPWTPIPGQTLITYDPPVGVTTTTYYKRVTTSTLNGQGCPADSNILTVTPTDLMPGVISENRTVCSGDIPAPLTGTVPASSGTLTYKWQFRPYGTTLWTDIPGTNTADYVFTSGFTSNTDYRRTVTSSVMGCERISNFVTIFANAITAPVISGDQTVCSTDDPFAFTVTTVATGSSTLTYQWQQATSASGPWSTINLAIGATYDPPVLSETTYYHVVVTSTLNGLRCSDTSNMLMVSVNTNLVAVAGSASPSSCSDTSIKLFANHTGTWTAVPTTPGALYSFSSITDPNATFTGESDNTYTITWTITNPPCAPTLSTFALVFPACEANIDFNGSNNYSNFSDKFDFTTDFSMELWIKRNNTAGGIQTLVSKRDAADLSTGYDFGVNNGRLTFNWNAAGSIQAPQMLGNSRWYHVAITHVAGAYTLYIDGINVVSTPGGIPTPNAFNALLGATGRSTNVPQDYYNGSMDEVRIWNTGLTEAQIREMMNQEIEDNAGAVRGSEIKQNVSGLTWADLEGYYQMNQTSDISAGQLADNSGIGNVGTLTNMISDQLQSAPLPYESSNDGNWTSPATWKNGNVQQIPNTDGVNDTAVDWNIVRTNHDVNVIGREITVLGLLVNNNRLSIQHNNPDDGQSVKVTKYLDITNDAVLDLVGESQLIQGVDSSVGAGEGTLERDQQGTGNEFNYNYWGSPVHNLIDRDGKRTYALGSILYGNGGPIVWIPGRDANTGTNIPVIVSTRWLHLYEHYTGAYADWHRINQFYDIPVGLGFTMKGSGSINDDQNYTFKGRPNNGEILIPILANNNVALIGNPYPSAIDADQFIDDNVGALLDGALQFWEHAPGGNTHILSQYQGRYSYYVKTGSVPAAEVPGPDGAGGASKSPKRYIPVGQGFFVDGNITGGTIVFNNAQREFKKESGGESEFLRASDNSSKESKSRNTSTSKDEIQRVRLSFKTPEGATRHLLLGFTPNNAATDGIDYGYDASNSDSFPSDLSFAIGGKKFVIQGVGEFDVNKKYLLDMNLGIKGPIKISLTDLENFEAPIDVYVHDALLDTYTKINDLSFQLNLEKGNYIDRFSIVFQPDSTLSTIDQDFKEIHVKYLQKTDEIYVKTPGSIEVRQVYLINMAGQAVNSWNMTNMNFGQEFKIPVKNISEGNYILKVETSTNSYNKKMIIKYK